MLRGRRGHLPAVELRVPVVFCEEPLWRAACLTPRCGNLNMLLLAFVNERTSSLKRTFTEIHVRQS